MKPHDGDITAPPPSPPSEEYPADEAALSPELHDARDVARRVDAADVVEIADVQTAVDAPRQSHRRQQLVALGLPVAAGAGDAPAPPVAHDGGDDGRLQGDELVLPAAFVEDPWREETAVVCRCEAVIDVRPLINQEKSGQK